ncbi:MAG: botulinum neurotoxin N-terminal receptor binding domain-containing protein [Sedimentisphaerales bacterium]
MGKRIKARISGEIFLYEDFFNPDLCDFSMCFWWQNNNEGCQGTDYTLFQLRQGIGNSGPLVMIWFDPDTGGGVWRCIMSQDDNPANYIEITSSSYVNNTNIFVVATFNRDGLMNLYINGILIGSADISSLAATVITPSLIEFNHGGNPHTHLNTTYFDQFRYYKDKILSQDEISAIYNNGNGATVNPEAFAVMCNDGCYLEFNDDDSAISDTETLAETFLFKSLTDGVWDIWGEIKAYLQQYNFFGQWSMEDGGVSDSVESFPHSILTVTSEHGSVAPQDGVIEVNKGSQIELTVTAHKGYKFTGWSGTAVSAGKTTDPSNATITVTVDDDYTLIANFVFIGGHRIYRRQDGAGDYQAVAMMNLNDTQVAIPSQTLPANTIWHFIRRQVAPCGLESHDSPVCIIKIDADGEMRTLTPNKPLSLMAMPLAGGKVLLRWRYTPTDQEIAPTGFNVYIDSGAGFNFAAPDAVIDYGLRGHGEFQWESPAYSHGSRRKFCVRSFAANFGESQNTDYAAAIADALGPDAIAGLTATVEQIP